MHWIEIVQLAFSLQLHVNVLFPQIKRQKHSSSEGDIDDGISNYDYDNPNDRENFCPDIAEVRQIFCLQCAVFHNVHLIFCETLVIPKLQAAG